MVPAEHSALVLASASGTGGEHSIPKTKKTKKVFSFVFLLLRSVELKETVALQLAARAQQVRTYPNVG